MKNILRFTFLLTLLSCLAIESTAQYHKVHRKPMMHNKPHTRGTYHLASNHTTTTTQPKQSSAVVKDIQSVSLSADSKLKIVIVIGEDPIDHLKSFQEEHQKDVDYLKSQGHEVAFFHSPDAEWKAIAAQAKGADIFVYSGHGGHPESTMMYISSGDISPEMISNDLKLAKNAVVLFNHVCYSAGSSAGDTTEIGKDEAARRVKLYATPFITNGAAVYYANNYSKSTLEILKQYFSNTPFTDIVKEPVYWTYSDGRVVGSAESVELCVTQPYTVSGYELGVYREKEKREQEQYTYVGNNPTPIIRKLPAMYDYGVGYVYSKDFKFDKRKLK